MGRIISLSKIFVENRQLIELNPLKIGDEIEFPFNIYDGHGEATGRVVPLRGEVIAIRNDHEELITLPKFVIRVYSGFVNYYKKCGPKDICRLGRYEQLFENPMRNLAIRAQVSEYLLDIENQGSESCQYETMKTKAVIHGFYHIAGGSGKNPVSLDATHAKAETFEANRKGAESLITGVSKEPEEQRSTKMINMPIVQPSMEKEEIQRKSLTAVSNALRIEAVETAAFKNLHRNLPKSTATASTFEHNTGTIDQKLLCKFIRLTKEVERWN